MDRVERELNVADAKIDNLVFNLYDGLDKERSMIEAQK
jgi:hypothetical protein